MSKVAVLGCGPAGMMAAWVAHQLGHEIHILAPGQKSVLHGAQYLHDDIPGIEVSPTLMEYLKVGTRAGYALKVYGSSTAECSWDTYPEGPQLAWPLRAVYELAWERLSKYIVPTNVSARNIGAIVAAHDLVVSTIPKPVTCLLSGKHEFKSQPVWIEGAMPFLDNGLAQNLEENTIMYNGLSEDNWYRFSKIMGSLSTEYAVSMPRAMKVLKPLSNTCTCHPGLMYIGRYGKWQKNVLVHNAYWEVKYALQRVS